MTEKTDQSKKFSRMSQSDMPRATLKEVTLIAEALRDQFAGKDATPIDLAQAMSRSPSSSAWRFYTGAAVAYGLTTAAYNSNSISLTQLGLRLAMPTQENDDKNALMEAAMAPTIPRSFYEKYNRNKLPSETIAKNVLQQLGVPHDRVDEAFNIVISNARIAGFVTVVGGSEYIQLRDGGERSSAPQAQDDEDVTDVEEATPVPQAQAEVANMAQSRPRPIFLAHGKDQKPLEQLKAILSRFKIPYRVAVDEPNGGRPISGKVRDLMNECGSAIIIFSSGGEAADPEKGSIANLNVVFELGAASVLYGDKIILFKEEGITLPSDFSDLGHISFEKDRLDSRALDLLSELIKMGSVQVMPVS